MKSTNPFKVGDVISFKVDNTEDGRLISKNEVLIVSSVFGHCVSFHGSEDPWHYKAFELVK